MCRLAAFPAGTTKERAHEIVAAFLGNNDDGVGSAYVKDGEFIVKKYPYGYKDVVTKKEDLFEHMPYKGWTIAHVRFATHGGNTLPNTHPIIRGDIVGAHNGVFGAHDILRIALDGGVKWSGETDSEVGLYMLNKLGPEQFYKTMPGGSGVFLALKRDGSLAAVKCSGELRFLSEGGKWIIGSSFNFKEHDIHTDYGFYLFNPDGTENGWKPPKKDKTERYPYSTQDIRWKDRRFCGAEDDYQYGCGTNSAEPSTSLANNSHYVYLDGVYVTKEVYEERRKAKESQKKQVTQPSLWNWKTEQEILDYMRAT